MQNKRFDTRRMVMLALFCAVACVVMLLFPRIKVSFLTFDIKDAVIAVAAMLFGPAAGALIALTVATLELFSVSDTGIYGWLMNFFSSATFSVLASSIYRHGRRMWSAVIALMTAVLGLTAVMLGLNLLITPLYTGWSIEEVAAIIPSLLLPFNFIKATLNAALVMVFYKPISIAMKKARITEYAEGEGKPTTWRSVTFTVIGVLIIAICIFIFIDLMGGSFSLIQLPA